MVLKLLEVPVKIVTFAQPDEKMAYFNLGVGTITGIGKVQIIATSGKEKSTYDVEIDMTNPNPVTNTFTDVILEPNSSKTISWKTIWRCGKQQGETGSFVNANY